MYKRLPNIDDIIRIADNAWIPRDENNTDYQAYIRWMSEENGGEEAPLEE